MIFKNYNFIIARSGVGIEIPLVTGRVRVDRRCGGGEFALDDGTPSECDGGSANPCCSKWGYCGPGEDHCGCPTCKDYRSPEQKQASAAGEPMQLCLCRWPFAFAVMSLPLGHWTFVLKALPLVLQPV